MLKNIGITPLVCDKSTTDLAAITQQADIIVSATGVPKLLNSHHIKAGAIVIDAGSGQLNGKTCGDCDATDMLPKVKYITPVPGGVGPITIATLTQNIVAAWQLQNPDKNIVSKVESIAIVTSSSSWFLPHAQQLQNSLRSNCNTVDLFTDVSEVNKSYSIVFILSYFDVLPKTFLEQHAMCLIAHESKLPHVRGWAPFFWQILKGKSAISISLILATMDKTSGGIILTKKINLTGLELYAELRQKQADVIFDLCKKFLIKIQKSDTFLKAKMQIGGASIYRRRTPEDSELNINKTLKGLFTQLRIASNEDFPAFFYYKNKKFVIKIFEQEENSTQE